MVYHPLGFDNKAAYHEFLEGPYARVPKELGCALSASFLVSPLVSIIDKAIVQEITCVQSLARSMGGAFKDMVLQPRAFLKGLSFRLTFAVYFGTYAVANLSEAALDYFDQKEEQTRKTVKVGCASVANVSLLAWRDSIFARAFSGGDNSKKPAKTPMRTVGLFAVRDSCTMTATFWAAPLVCEHLVEEYGWDRNKAEIVSAFGVPVVSQFFTAPLHIHALDYYSRPTATNAERIVRIKEEMGKVCFARGLRILPAFGIGSYSNNKFREWFIRQPDEELLLSRQLTRRMTAIVTKVRGDTKPVATSSKERKDN
jgi:hypothetical protein